MAARNAMDPMGGMGVPGGATRPNASTRQSTTRTELEARAICRSINGDRRSGGDPRAKKRK
jgi:hypothetical protein